MNRFENSDSTYPLFPIFAFLGFLLPLVPLPWHFQAWNSGTCWYIFWASISCLGQFVNSIVWAGNTLNSVPAWCEVSIRIMMGASVGLPAASLCINRRLYHIATVRAVVITKAEKQRAVLIDSLICGLFPAVYIAMQYIVQGHRFNILEDIGCYPNLYNTLPTYFISSMWPVLIGLVSAVYCVLSLRAFAARRAAFAEFLSAHNALTPSRYLRLSALALTDLLLTVPLALFTIALNLTATPVSPWISWADTHFDFGRVEQIPHFIWAANNSSRIAVELTRWASPACALVFFAFFGFAAEARRNYSLVGAAITAAFWRAAGYVGIKRPATGFFAAKSISSSQSGYNSKGGIGYTKPKPPLPHAISLPAYSPSGTGAFATASPSHSSQFTADLKRTASFASTSTASASTSRFVEHLAAEAEKKVATADTEVDVQPETPATATSFASDTSASSSATFAALPLYLGWHARPYPAVFDPRAVSSDARSQSRSGDVERGDAHVDQEERDQ